MNPCFIKSNVEYNEDHITLHFTVLDRQYQMDITDAIDRTNGFINWSKVVTILTQHNFNPDVATKLSVVISYVDATRHLHNLCCLFLFFVYLMWSTYR